MLVLTRSKGEQIVINDNIVITVLGSGTDDRPLSKLNEIRIGIDAPKWVQIDRKEIHDRKMNERLDKTKL